MTHWAPASLQTCPLILQNSRALALVTNPFPLLLGYKASIKLSTLEPSDWERTQMSAWIQLLTMQTGKRRTGKAEDSGEPLLAPHCAGCCGSMKLHCAGSWVLTLCGTHSANTTSVLAQVYLWRLRLFPIPGRKSHKYGFLHLTTLPGLFWHSTR